MDRARASQSNSSLLTAIVPTYNAAPILPRLLQSFEESTAQRIQVVMVDDGSHDGTTDVAQAWIEDSGRGLLVRSLHGGPAAARQRGLDLSETDFVTFVDADDDACWEALEVAAHHLDALGADLAILAVTSEQGMSKPSASHGLNLSFTSVSADRALTSRAAVWGKVYRRSFLRDHGIRFPEVPVAEDVIFSWALATARPRTYESQAVGYAYRNDSGSQLTRDQGYVFLAARSLGMLGRLAQGKGIRARGLAAYAYASGCLYLLKRCPPEERPRLVRILGQEAMSHVKMWGHD